MERINPSSSARTWIGPQTLQAIIIHVQNWTIRQSIRDASPKSPQRAWREHPDFDAPATKSEVQKVLIGKLLNKVFALLSLS